MSVFQLNVDAAEQVVVHELAIALLLGGGHAIVLVQVVGHGLAEVNRAFLVQLGQIVISGDGRRTRRKAEYAGGLFSYLSREQQSGALAQGLVILAYDDFHDKNTPCFRRLASIFAWLVRS